MVSFLAFLCCRTFSKVLYNCSAEARTRPSLASQKITTTRLLLCFLFYFNWYHHLTCWIVFKKNDMSLHSRSYHNRPWNPHVTGPVNTLRLWQNGHQFANANFKLIFIQDQFCRLSKFTVNKTKTCPYCFFNTMVADGLAIPRGRASPGIVMV